MDKKKVMIIAGSVVFVVVAIVIVLLMLNKKPNIYSVSFDTGGGSLVESQMVNEGEQVKKPVDPTKDGYMFVEWTYQDKTYDFSLSVSSDFTLTARWIQEEESVETFTVKFDSNGGTTISNQIVEKGNKVAKPIDPIKDGYTFKGWLLGNNMYDFSTIIEENIELKAEWEKVKENNNGDNDTTKPTTPTSKKYTVTFNSNGGSSVKSQIVTEGGKVSKPSNPTRNGYTFAGWTLNGSAYNFDTKVTKNITLVAKWTEEESEKKNYTVKFDSNGGGSVGSQTVTEGGKVSKPSDPTRSGYTFVGWTLNGSVYNFDTKITKNITLVAKWTEEESEKKNYTVKFDSNGGSSVSSQTVTEGGKVSKPSDPTRSGYKFAGWTLNGSTYNFDTKVTKDITLVAKWNQKSYTVKVAPVDQYSPDRILTVYEDGTQISVSAIKYNGVTLCSGSNMVVNMYEISGISSVTVVLTNGSSVTASVQ